MAKKKKEEIVNNSVVLYKNLEDVMHDSMIPYAEYVILDRAIPRVEDGLKPVQRRILYSMFDLGLLPDKPYKKSARLVGECLGKYHPHGDTSVYDAMVRLAQPFNMRMQLVDGQGNFGTIDGDCAAAMRYTEAKLAPLALELLRDLDKDTVKWNLNFDDSVKEPDTLPGRYPNLLVNGSMGIAVGLATNIPPHNLGEVIDGVIAYIDRPTIKLCDMMKIIQGPDFPTGGFVFCGNELEQAYATGRGKITLRAKFHIEGEPNEKQSIVVTELPYQVNKATLLQRILALREQDKATFGAISDICDESDRNGMRAVIKLKKDTNAQKIVDKLLKKTDLQCNFGINIVAIADGKPQQMGLMSIIYYYVNYQREVIIRRTKYDLSRAKERAHIVEGLLVAVKNIDKVIKIIKSSASVSIARQGLRDAFSLSERQAQAILDMRLARLTALEVGKLEDEYRELMELIDKLTKILASKSAQMSVIKEELRDIKKRFKSPRKSILLQTEEQIPINLNVEDKGVIDICVGISNGNTLKRLTVRSVAGVTKEVSPNTEDYQTMSSIIQTKDDHTILVFSNKGNCFKIPADSIPECRFRDKGTTLNKICKDAEKDEYPIKLLPTKGNSQQSEVVFVTKNGMIRKTNWQELIIQKSYYQAIKLKDNDEVIKIEEFDKNATMLFVTQNGMTLNADMTDVPLQGRVAGGVKGIALSEGDFVVFAGQVIDEGEIAVITSRGFAHRVLVCDLETMTRYRKGVRIIDLKGDKPSKVIYAGLVKNPFTVVVKTSDDESISFSTENILIEDRNRRGKCVKDKVKNMEALDAFKHEINSEIIVEE